MRDAGGGLLRVSARLRLIEHHLIGNADLFTRVRGRTYRMNDDQQVFRFGEAEGGDWKERFVTAVTAALDGTQEQLLDEKASPAEAMLRLDLSGLVEGEPVLLTEALRAAARSTWEVYRRRKRGSRRGVICVKWADSGRAAGTLRSAVQWRWELLDLADPKTRLALPLVLDNNRRGVFGHLPTSLSGERLVRLAEHRLVTYHTLAIDPSLPGNTPKALGKLLSTYERIGLLIKRGYLSQNEVKRLDTVPGFPTGNVQAWESTLAAAGGSTPNLHRR